ncbi:MAG: hypothetical protein WCV00_13215 [Verrucomicrobiia bacterium]
MTAALVVITIGGHRPPLQTAATVSDYISTPSDRTTTWSGYSQPSSGLRLAACWCSGFIRRINEAT